MDKFEDPKRPSSDIFEFEMEKAGLSVNYQKVILSKRSVSVFRRSHTISTDLADVTNGSAMRRLLPVRH